MCLSPTLEQFLFAKMTESPSPRLLYEWSTPVPTEHEPNSTMSNIPDFSVIETLEVIYTGITVGVVLFGVLVHQSYIYFKQCSEDRLYIKAIVILTLLIEALHSVLWGAAGYCYVTEVLDISELVLVHWPVRVRSMFKHSGNNDGEWELYR
ncbi:hypothetical protein C8Q78DRAFT_1057022 [Trametes maxima]|nr:hypothetical protein C8Q78DRAFT_1057022 [Trametes maxima]